MLQVQTEYLSALISLNEKNWTTSFVWSTISHSPATGLHQLRHQL